ncbi:polyprenyl synthetase family protein [Rhodobacterales bacterium HKCCE2091]|nr:polyprenyl synthetase family protein [Rhodobacterales bacterium HKCCE2091]
MREDTARGRGKGRADHAGRGRPADRHEARRRALVIRAELAAAQAQIGAWLAGALSDFGDDAVAAAMRYACDGGKRVRGYLALASARLHGVDADRAMPVAAAVEAVHAYSLIHDDLPAMDDDDLRRGRPTVHVAWDEATAILAGDALLTFAFELLSRPEVGPADVRITLVSGLSRAAGAGGMVLGQARDIAAETAARPLMLDEIVELQRLKTGRLIEWPAVAGAVLGGADPAPMRGYAAAIGLAFQVADDILDVTGDELAAGKRLRKDGGAGKATFVSLLGLDEARARADALADEACDALSGYGAAADPLRDLARFIVARDR